MNTKIVTMKDIANELNISINAVSIALNNKKGVSEQTRRKIINEAEKLGYFDVEKKYIKTFANSNLCLMIDNMYVNDLFYCNLISRIQEYMRQKGYDMILNFFNPKSFDLPNCIVSKKVSGIVIAGNIDYDYIDTIYKSKIPVVLIDNLSFLSDIDSIVTNNISGTYKATDYLIKKGYSDIGFFGDIKYSSSVENRFLGYKNRIKQMLELKSINSDIDGYIASRSIISNIEKHIISNDNKSILELVNKIKHMPKAFICSNDNAAVKLMISLKNIKYKIPSDISIIGFDDISICELISPRLTTLKVDKDSMAKKTVEKLIERIYNTDKIVEVIQIGVKIVERDSVK